MLGKIKNLYELVKFSLAYLVSLIYKKEIFLVGEREDQAQDNGYHFFKYTREVMKDDRFYYCIDKKSNQVDRVSKYGNVVYIKSFKHYLYYILAKKIICAHIWSCTPDTWIVWKLKDNKVLDKNRVFIQHGITKEKIESLMCKKTKLSTFVCGAKPEYEFIKKNFGYKENQVKYLGFCRFDALKNFETKKQILIMPTWRNWLGLDVSGMSNLKFVESDYYDKYNSLLNNKKIYELTSKHGYEVIFYPHNETQKYIGEFNTKYKNFHIANKSDYDVQKLLKESEILITDYSSVAFDFAYMKKQLIYYQFDTERYYKNHYQKGYFEYERDGFGPVVDNEIRLVNSLEIMISNKNTKENKYEKRVDDFFILNDMENCKRTYDLVKENTR